jgi:hypothetical protein
MQSCDGLSEGRSLRGTVGGVQLGFLHPAQERFSRDARRPRSFLHGPVREKRDDRILLLTAEF